MNDFNTMYHTVKRIDNSRVIRPSAPVRLRDFWRRLAIGLAMVAILLSYAWQHFRCIQIRYSIEELSAERARATEMNQQLHLEVATLRSPLRVDSIARNQLGLTVPVPGQMAPVLSESDGVLADARAEMQPPRP